MYIILYLISSKDTQKGKRYYNLYIRMNLCKQPEHFVINIILVRYRTLYLLRDNRDNTYADAVLYESFATVCAFTTSAFIRIGRNNDKC